MLALLMGVANLSPTQLHQAMQEGQVWVFDVNSHQSWVKARVSGALNLDPAHFSEQQLPTDKQSRLVFYCSNPLCTKAPTAARRAKKMGYTQSMVMAAGISGWLGAKLPVESGE